ncbi:hypothetical protein XENOCAPTIV_021674 [Xenoophorus captivus]|uniref:Uncharacterized protein n=1 Tax=Xenoophorus captivus TaxID=1517983 RepID=A0ABV0QW57_9TELE
MKRRNLQQSQVFVAPLSHPPRLSCVYLHHLNGPISVIVLTTAYKLFYVQPCSELKKRFGREVKGLQETREESSCLLLKHNGLPCPNLPKIYNSAKGQPYQETGIQLN